MPLNAAQLVTLKADIAADPVLSLLAHTADNAFTVAAAYNAVASPDYWVWRSSISRSDVYNGVAPGGSTWNWTFYKNQNVTEQGAWTQMFMGDAANVGNLNFRAGLVAIFTAGSSVNRDHVLALGRRLAKRSEKLFSVAVANPPANTGNNAADPRGATTNPDVLVFEGVVVPQDVLNAWNLP